MTEHVFVYGSLKRGFHNSHLLAAAELLGAAETAQPEFRMGDVDAYPEITRTDSDAAGYILGEVYACDPKTMTRLDQLEGNGSSYQRELITARLIDSAGDVNMMAWTYLWLRPPCPDVEPVRISRGKPVYEWRF